MVRRFRAFDLRQEISSEHLRTYHSDFEQNSVKNLRTSYQHNKPHTLSLATKLESFKKLCFCLPVYRDPR